MVGGMHILRVGEGWGASDHLGPTQGSTTDHALSVTSSNNTEDELELWSPVKTTNKQNQHSSENFKRIQNFKLNVKNVQDKVKNYLTYQKYDAFSREKTINRCKLQDDLNVGIIKQNLAVAGRTLFTEVKLNTSWDEWKAISSLKTQFCECSLCV